MDDPRPERLAEHARLLDELEGVGRWLFQATQSADFPDRSTADLVSMALQDLKDARGMAATIGCGIIRGGIQARFAPRYLQSSGRVGSKYLINHGRHRALTC